MTNYILGISAPVWSPFGGALLVALIVWSIFWKGLALWHSATRHSHWWFIVMLIINTAGILEIIYLFAVLRLRFSELFA